MPEFTDRAWLLLIVDIHASPPRVLAAGIFDSARPELPSHLRSTVLVDAAGFTPGEARQNLLNLIHTHDEYQWVRALYSRVAKYPAVH